VYANDWGPAASWSLDDRQVAFSAFADPNVDGTSAVYVVDTAAGDPNAIAGPVMWTTTARWSPDGTWIAFDHMGTGLPTQPDFFLIHPDGTGLRTLVRPQGVGVCGAHWSPNGAYLLVQGSPSADETQSPLYAASAEAKTLSDAAVGP
jgi:Tol biopolymer transport system component